jgi:thiol-disulfide isomerase/thioredoxin/uncharacterized membrane protein YphA (DoxX/SURF4 family)
MSPALWHDLLFVARVALIGVFALAGMSKLRDLVGTRQTLEAFGVPAAAAGPGAIAIAIAELATAASLAVAPAIGAAAALALSLVFLIAIAANLAQGRRPSCHCFGQVDAAPISGWSLAIDGAIVLAAAGLVWRGDAPGPSMFVRWFAGLGTAGHGDLVLQLLQLLVLSGLCLLVWEMLKQQGRLLLRLDVLEEHLSGAPATLPAATVAAPSDPRIGLPLGADAPAFELPDLSGARVSLQHLLAPGRPLLLVFSSPSCGPCRALAPDIRSWRERYSDRLTVVVVSEGTVMDHPEEGDHRTVLLQFKREVAEAYQAWGTPSALLLSPSGAVASGVAAGAEQIARLVASATSDEFLGAAMAAEPAEPPSHQDITTIELSDLDGVRRHVFPASGRDSLVLFWNNDCGYCRRMLDGLRGWDAERSDADPILILIADGPSGPLRDIGLSATVFLDPGFAISAAFGASGTPMAVMLDGQAQVASELVAGEDAIFALAKAHPRRSGPKFRELAVPNFDSRQEK